MAQPCPPSRTFDSQDTNLLQDLISRGLDPNQNNEPGIPILYLLIKSGFEEGIDAMIEAAAVLNSELFVDIAINLNDIHVASWLVKNGVLSDLTKAKLLDFFFWSATNNLSDVIYAIVEHGVDLDVCDSTGLGALHHAILSPKDTIEVIELLLTLGANPNLRCGKSKGCRTPLHLASLANDPIISSKITKVLLDAGAERDTTDDLRNTPLHFAIQSINNTTMELLLAAGANINATGGWMNRTPLMFAIIAKNKEAFDILIENGCDIHILDRDNSSAVGHAVYAHTDHASPYMLWCLLMLGGDPNSGAGIWKYPLHTDLNYGKGKFSRMLIFFGADVNVKGLQVGSALAISGRVPCSLEITKMLLDAGADVTAGCSDALSWIVGHGYNAKSYEHAELLLEAGADVSGDRNGLSPLEEAIIMQRSGLIPILLKYGAHADMVRWAPYNPLGYIREGGYANLPDLKCLEIMLQNGAKINNKDAHGMETAPLHAAARMASYPHVKLLLEGGADPNEACLKYSMTPLHYIAGSGRPSKSESWRFDPEKNPSSAPEVVELFLANNADPLGLDLFGRLPLHYASGSGKTSVVRMLLQSGGSASAETADSSGVTALHLATSPEIVTLLIENGASPSARDKLKRTPLQMAMRRRHEDVFIELLSYSVDDDIRYWMASPRGDINITWYVFASLAARIALLRRTLFSMVRSSKKVRFESAPKIPERRKEEDVQSFILSLSPENFSKTADEARGLSLGMIRMILLALLVSIIAWRSVQK